MDTKKTWLEVSLNGPLGRARQPRIPVSVKEIVEEAVACANAGAAIIHVHAYDEATGRQKDDGARYERIITEVRSRADAIVYPTVPLAGLPGHPGAQTPQERFVHTQHLAQRGLFSSGYTFSFPPDDYGLTAYLTLMDQVAPGGQWMIGGLSVDVVRMIPRVVMEGGHVRVGLEDAPLGSERTMCSGWRLRRRPSTTRVVSWPRRQTCALCCRRSRWETGSAPRARRLGSRG
jgi:uncharacterized protein (DUF849 family)